MSSSRFSNNMPTARTRMTGGSVAATNIRDDSEAFYMYKARKYHEKIRMKLMEMEHRGMKCPDGYEQYKVPFENRTY